MRTDDERRLPIETERAFTLALDRPDVDALAGPPIEPHDAAVLRLRIDDVGIGRIDARDEAIAASDHEPIVVGGPVRGARLRGTAECGVILCAAVDVVDWRGVVDFDVIELRD